MYHLNSLEPLAQGLKIINVPNETWDCHNLKKNESPKIAEVATIVIRAFLPHRVQRHSVDEVVSIRLYYCSFSVFALWPRCFLQRSPHKFQHSMGWTDMDWSLLMIIRNTADFQTIFSTVARDVVLMPWAVADQNWTQHGQIVGRSLVANQVDQVVIFSNHMSRLP